MVKNQFIWIILAMGVLLITTQCRVSETHERRIPVTPVVCNDCATVDVELNQYIFVQNEPITVTVTVSVPDNEELLATYQDSPLSDFIINIVNKQGQPISLTKQGFFMETDAGSIGAYHSYPFQRQFRIDPWFELSQPDTYTLTVSFTGTDAASRFVEVIGDSVVFTRLE